MFFLSTLAVSIALVWPQQATADPLDAYRCSDKDGQVRYSSDCPGIDKRKQAAAKQKKK